MQEKLSMIIGDKAMIKCCAFGTVRIDVHVYTEYDRLSTQKK